MIHFLLAVPCFSNITLQDSTEVVMYVNDEPIRANELMFFLEEERTNVFMHFTNAYHISIEKGFWQSAFEGVSPLSFIRHQAINRLISIKVQQQIMKSYGIKPSTDFSDFLKEWTDTNWERRKAVAEGQVVYGPVNYQKRNYFFHVFNNDVLKLKRTLAHRLLAIPDSACHAYYETHQSAYHAQGNTFEQAQSDILLRLQNEKYEEVILQNINVACIEIDSMKVDTLCAAFVRGQSD